MDRASQSGGSTGGAKQMSGWIADHMQEDKARCRDGRWETLG